jgi:voltage-gated potassium channel
VKTTRFPLIRKSHTAQLLIGAIAFVIIIVAVGTLSFETFEGLGLLDALYATLNTVTTVGRSMREFTSAGKIVSMAVMVVGTIAVTLVIGLVTRALVEGQIRTMFGRRRMEKQIDNLENHVLVCGYGRMGRIIARELADAGVSFVVIEKYESAFRQIEEEGYLGVHGDATHDEILLRCGIKAARALISVTPSDADNVFVTLSARELNPKVFVVVRANEDSAIEKLRKAGADRVFSPYRAGGRLMAQAALRPNVIDFLAEVGGVPGAEHYQIEELIVEPGSPICGKSLRELNLSRTLSVIIIGLRRQGGPMAYNPSAETTLAPNDILIALAPTDRLSQLAEMASPEGQRRVL